MPEEDQVSDVHQPETPEPTAPDPEAPEPLNVPETPTPAETQTRSLHFSRGLVSADSEPADTPPPGEDLPPDAPTDVTHSDPGSLDVQTGQDEE